MRFSLFFVVIGVGVLALSPAAPGQTGSVTVNPAVTHQTMMGWNATMGKVVMPTAQRDQILDTVINDLGLTSFRVHGDRRDWEDVINDNGNPFVTNSAAFKTTGLDTVAQWLTGAQQRIEANGETMMVQQSPAFYDSGTTGSIPIWMLKSAGEYTEWALNSASYLKNTYNIKTDYWCIANEAGYNNQVDTWALARIARTLGPALQKIDAKIAYSDFYAVSDATNAINGNPDPKIWPYVGLVSYHLYGGRTDAARNALRTAAAGLNGTGVPTAQTEWNGGATIATIFDDVTKADASIWAQYTTTYYGNASTNGNYVSANTNGTSITLTDQFWKFRQIMYYVRPGDVRIDGSSSTYGELMVMPFKKPNGDIVTVVAGNGTTRNIVISGLAPGATYGVSQATGSAATSTYQEMGLRTASASGQVSISVPSDGVVTVYPHTVANMAPVVTTWKAANAYLRTGVSSSTTLTGGAQDPELNSLSYTWTLASAPAGANVQFANANAASTTVSGLTAAGQYTFHLTASDGSLASSKDVTLNVWDRNQSPIFAEVLNRQPVTLVAGTDTSTTLSGYAYDPESSAVTYSWQMISQPGGSAAVLTNPTLAKPTLSNLAVAGDYVFRLTASDGTDTSSTELTVKLWPANANAPYINTIGTIAGTPVKLIADAGDVDGDVTTYWWTKVNGPTGGEIVFGNGGEDQASLTPSLWATVAGTYTLQLDAIDRTKDTNKTITVFVPVPEPSAAALVLLGGALLLRRRSRG